MAEAENAEKKKPKNGKQKEGRQKWKDDFVSRAVIKFSVTCQLIFCSKRTWETLKSRFPDRISKIFLHYLKHLFDAMRYWKLVHDLYDARTLVRLRSYMVIIYIKAKFISTECSFYIDNTTVFPTSVFCLESVFNFSKKTTSSSFRSSGITSAFF